MGSAKSKKSRTKILLALYICAILAYIFIGFQPAPSSASDFFESASAESSASAETSASGRSPLDKDSTEYLIIDSIDLKTPVRKTKLENRTLSVPDEIAGSFSENEHKTLLFGHSSTVFKNLKNVKFGDMIDYEKHSYKVTNITTRKKEDISMRRILKAEEKDTIVLMTCTGESLGKNDYTHRLIITAEAVD